jgi:hypothetical protein
MPERAMKRGELKKLKQLAKYSPLFKLLYVLSLPKREGK